MKRKNSGNILVIDDDEAMRNYVVFALEKAGHTVSACNDGTEGLRHFERGVYDLVITDIMMPGMDGLAAMIKMEKINKGVPVLAMSGADMKDALLDAADIFGAARTVKKPFARENLLWIVDDILGSVAAKA
jgi:CheY-like chemotaxis protein